ncbi:MAG: NrdH-redoxin [Armatimonadota bacterium]|nr:NrdH-redoxin [Armatimonadota bacterium]
MSQPRITMYTQTGCPDVARASYALRQHGLTWDEIDITEDDDARKQVVEWTGREVTPTLWIGDMMLVEPDAEEIDAAFAQAG